MWSKARRARPDVTPRSAGTLYAARVRQSWPIDRDFRILSIDGGGIRGILPLVFLAEMERVHLGGNSVARYFDLITGTSTGGIVALGLGAGLTATFLLNLYLERGGEVFPELSRIGRHTAGLGQLLFNRCDRKNLDRLIDDTLGNRLICDSAVRLCVPAAETRHFEPFIFKTPHHPDYRLDWRKPMSLAAKTTSAAPTYFCPVPTEDGYEFVDGGLWANNPIMVGIADALACFDIRREQIRVLSLGCLRDRFELGWARRHLGGMFFWRSAIFESMHLGSHNAVGQARLIIGGDRVFRVDAPAVRPKIEMWDWSRSKKEIPEMGRTLFTEWGERVRTAFLAEPASAYDPIYTPDKPPTAPQR